MRIGLGYDAHRFGAALENHTIRIGGVDIPFEQEVIAHSDGDVVVHALCDALLGAASLGDIGQHFSNKDEAWRDADSLEMLSVCIDKITAAGFEFGNADVTLIAQRPKISRFVETMRKTMAASIGCRVVDISVKATTTEGMGFEGRGEGLAAQAVVLLR